MGLRFRKSVKLGPFRINFSKSGIGYSYGVKGYRVTHKADGGVRTTASIPGTGISYVEEKSAKKVAAEKAAKSTPKKEAPAMPASNHHHLEFMPCPKCGKTTIVGDARCAHCNYILDPAKAAVSAKQGGGKGKLIAGVLAGVVALGGVGIMLGGGDEAAPAPTPAPVPEVVTPAPEPSTPAPAPDVATPAPAPESDPEPAPEPEIAAHPDPIVYTGSGDNVIEIGPFDGIWVLDVSGNSGGNHFAVKGYDSVGESTELFVNTTKPYSGITYDPDQATSLLEVSAEGSWEIVMRSLGEMDMISQGETISGSGDEVLLVESCGTTATIIGNATSNHFSVKSYGYTGNNLMVNTTDPYNGTVMLKDNPLVLVITSENDWEITFN